MNCRYITLICALCLISILIIATVVILTLKSKAAAAEGRFSSSEEENETFVINTEKLVETINELNTLLTAQCKSHSTILWDYLLKSGYNNENAVDGALSKYLASEVRNEFFIQGQRNKLKNIAKLTKENVVDFKNKTLAIAVGKIQKLLQKSSASTNKESEEDFKKLLQLKIQYNEALEPIYMSFQNEIAEFEDWEEDNLFVLRNLIESERRKVNLKIWTEFNNKFGAFVKKSIAPSYLTILQGQRGSFQAEDDFYTKLDETLIKLQPLYKLLYAYVRGKAAEMGRGYAYPPKTWANATSPIPVHWISPFGNWFHFKDDIVPYDQLHFGHVTFNIMNIKQLERPIELLQLADKLFISLNLTKLPETIWQNSVFITYGRNDFDFDNAMRRCEMVFNLCKDDKEEENYQTIFCDGINYDNFRDFHKKLGTIRFLQMAQPKQLNLPVNQRINPVLLHANELFWELLSTSPSYLDRLGLWEHVDWLRTESMPADHTSTINFQYSQALYIIPTLFEFITLQKWKLSLVQGKINLSTGNCHYWDLRKKYEGVTPPNTRSAKDFDTYQAFNRPQAEQIDHFYGLLLGFQLHNKICTESGEFNPSNPAKSLQQCDLTGNPIASELIQRFLSADGTFLNKPLENIFDYDSFNNINADALLEYFDPLFKYLSVYNFENGFPIGWDENTSDLYESCCTDC